MTRYAAHVNARATSQKAPARDDQVRNNAGGFVFAVDEWTRLDRFLVLGSEGGTYYVGERELTRENAQIVTHCLNVDGLRTVERIVEISDAGRAPKNDPAIFALAMAAAHTSLETRKAALAALPKVCRIGTHLFHFITSVKSFRGWGPSLVRAVANWYTERDSDKLAYDLVKYQSRDGQSHKNLIKLSHPKAPSPAHKAALTWSARGGERLDEATLKKGGGERGSKASLEWLPDTIVAFEALQALSKQAIHPTLRSSGDVVRRACRLIVDHRLPQECVPNEFKSSPEIWGALLEHMGPEALIRNLNKMTAVGLLKPLSSDAQKAQAKLTDSASLFKARIHPLRILISMRQYAAGHGGEKSKSELIWTPVQNIIDALDEAFYLSFEAIEPTNKRHLIAIDCSDSMTWRQNRVAGSTLTAREGAAAMAMASVHTEKQTHVMGFSNTLVDLPLSKRQRLDDVVETIASVNAGDTDCSLPMLYALENGLEVDCFSVYTDNETHSGHVHPFQALRAYRERTGIPAKLVVVGMSATGFTIADPSDAGMLDVVGFDSATPAVIADFAADREVRA